MRHGNAAVCHHDHQIPQAQFEARVPAHAQNDDLSVEVPSFEQIFDRYEPLHLFIIARHPRVLHQSRFSRVIWGLALSANGRRLYASQPDLQYNRV